MNVKLYISDIDTISYIKYACKHHNIKFDIIELYEEDGKQTEICFILMNVKSVKQSADNIRIDTDKISIYASTYYINGMFMEVIKE